jgi:uncharacterized protein YbjT (DUF2867 family)
VGVVIFVPGRLDPPAGRLLAALAAGGAAVTSDARTLPAEAGVTIALSSGPFPPDLSGLFDSLAGRPCRALVLSRLGAHPDARHPALQRLWRLEEQVRGGGQPSLTLRFAPVLGPDTPLWNKLRARPSLPRGGRQLLNPVSERDALETLRRALDGRVTWAGWYEVAGPEAWTLAELRDLAAAAGPGPGAGAWEPPLAEMAEHRLAESGPWAEHFGLAPERVADAVREVVS